MPFDEQRFRAIVIQSLQIPDQKFRPDLRLGDLEEWDSVAHLGLISAIEETFDVRFKAEELVELTSLDLLRARLR